MINFLMGVAMPRYAHIVKKTNEDEFEYTVIDENNSVIANCKDIDIAKIIRDEYDAIRNISKAS